MPHKLYINYGQRYGLAIALLLLILFATSSCANAIRLVANERIQEVAREEQGLSNEKASPRHRSADDIVANEQAKLLVGAERMDIVVPMLEAKRVAVFINHTSVVGETKISLLDTLLSHGVLVKKVFVPEHGFRGTVDAGKVVKDGCDSKTGLPVISLYGELKKPTPQHLADIDVLVFDLQDVGCRFYTYISSLLYAMEAVAESNKQIVVLDRPNPNDYIDGPLLAPDCRSFVGLMPIPILYGMTVGELATMINGEGWLAGKRKAKLDVVPLKGWSHGDAYELPVAPSPNLPNAQAVKLYPSLCLFEGTSVSVGRGTDSPFQILGYPDRRFGSFAFVPTGKPGANNPLHKGKHCYGVDLRADQKTEGLSLAWLIHFSQKSKDMGVKFITRPRMFELLAGNKQLAKQLANGLSEEEIVDSWQEDLRAFKARRKLYLLYPDFSDM